MSLALGYVLGMAVTLAIVGALIGSFGRRVNLQARLQSPGCWAPLRCSLCCSLWPCLVSLTCACRALCVNHWSA
ncbi:hypothetical protein ULF88_16575 [Halopseudomonas pachastrellae]|nr:hypothetical protein [Halopseudomonas pachastrellae]